MITKKLVAVVYESECFTQLIGCADNMIEASGIALEYIADDLFDCEHDTVTINFFKTDGDDDGIEYTSPYNKDVKSRIMFLTGDDFTGFMNKKGDVK